VENEQDLIFYSTITKETATFTQGILSIDETYSTEWKKENVYGRNDPIITFANTEREMNFSFLIINPDPETAKTNIANLNRLTRFMYPYYSEGDSATTISQSPLMRIKFSNFIFKRTGTDAAISGLLCGITSLGINIGEEMYEPDSPVYSLVGNGSQELVPEKIELSVSLIPLHEPIGGTMGWNRGKGGGKQFGGTYKNNNKNNEFRFPSMRSIDIVNILKKGGGN
jgi:hypothetical protein